MLELGFVHSMFIGDAVMDIKALADGNCSVPSFGHILKDIESISGLLQTKSFSHVRRQGNTMAHALAQRARLSFPVLIWMEDVPPDIYHFVFADFPRA